jgi:hypothetical protein
MAYKISVGPISDGTLKTEDLLTAFADELERVCQSAPFVFRAGEKLTPVRQQLICDARTYAIMLEAEHLNTDGEECAAEIVNELQDALNECAPDYLYFGANEGDGACFGWWPSLNNLEEDVRCGDVLKVADTGHVPADYIGLVMHVSDHGNVTLYSKRKLVSDCLTELWSCV